MDLASRGSLPRRIEARLSYRSPLEEQISRQELQGTVEMHVGDAAAHCVRRFTGQIRRAEIIEAEAFGMPILRRRQVLGNFAGIELLRLVAATDDAFEHGDLLALIKDAPV